MSFYNLFVAWYHNQTVSNESGYGSRASFPSLSCLGAVNVAGVGGTIERSRLRFQNPALGTFIMKANVHRDKPRKVPGW